MKTRLFASILIASVLAAPNLNKRHVRHEQRDAGSQLIKRDALEPNRVLPMRIGLTQSNLVHGHDLLMQISDPDSPTYGKHLSVEEVYNLFAPSKDSVAAVRAWLADVGIDLDRVTQSTNKQWLQFQAEAAEVEQLLNTKFHYYEHESTGRTSIGCDEYHVAADIQHHIDYITPGIKTIGVENTYAKWLDKRGDSHRKRPGPQRSPIPEDFVANDPYNTAHCASFVTPACIMAVYNVTNGTLAESGNELGIFEDGPNFINRNSMNLFFQHEFPRIPRGTYPKINSIDGGKNEDKPDDSIEGLLDFQLAYPLIWPQQAVMFLTDTVHEYYAAKGFFNTFLDGIDGSYCTYSAFGETGNNNTVDPVYPSEGYEHPLQCGVFKPTNVISFSYAISELSSGTTSNYQKRQCSEYMKLAMQGVTLVFASGDDGTSSSDGCSGTKKKPVFSPSFPSTCPYVTSVGATLLEGSDGNYSERAVTALQSGGGFANYFARPTYQDAAVEAYFASPEAPSYPYYTGSSFTGYYNRSGRAYPDVSAIGQGVVNWGAGEPYLEGGTSAATPIFAAIINRINEERLKAGKSTVGFINPTLYKNPQAFMDVTVGNNKACYGKGFTTAKGWDPVTGLGTPNYPALLEVFMKAS